MMKRRGFLKLLGIGAAVPVIALPEAGSLIRQPTGNSPLAAFITPASPLWAAARPAGQYKAKACKLVR